jgi:phage-related protein
VQGLVNLTQYAQKGIIELMSPPLKPVEWISSARDDLREFPEEVQQMMGFALYRAQLGKKHPDAKPLKGFKGSDVLEIVENFDGETYRAVYTVKFEGIVYVLHAFQKKSKRGIATPKQDIDLIEARLKRAREHYETYLKQKKQEEQND